MSQVLLENCHIKYNLPRDETGKEGFAVHVPDESTTVVAQGVLTLMGWTRETARLINCRFERDPSMIPGTMLITPIQDGEPDGS